MWVKKYSDGHVKIHMEDSDSYAVTDDNGVDITLTQLQAETVRRIIS